MMRRALHGLLLVAIGIVLIVFGTWAGEFITGIPRNLTPDASPAPTVDPADLAPDFTLPALAGDPVRLSAQRGKAVIINFWASWCVPCLEELPLLVRFAAERREKVILYAINMQEEPETARTFAEGVELPPEAVLLSEDGVLLDYQVVALPVTFVVDRRGVLVCRHVGIITEAALAACVGP